MEWWGFPNDAMKWIVVLAVVVSLAFAVVLLSRGYKALRSRRERKRIVPPEARRENKAPASAAPELSGRAWVERFPGSKSVDDLEPNFRRSVKGFLKALADAGADVTISATFRPPERAYLMHYAWEIAHEEQDARHVPHMPDVNIEWAHDTNAASRDAALEMVDGYGMRFVAALHSRHTERKAIDMSISWVGILSIRDAYSNVVPIASEPRDGDNHQLQTVGRSFGVVKLASDPPHWSTDGH